MFRVLRHCLALHQICDGRAMPCQAIACGQPARSGSKRYGSAILVELNDVT